MEKILKAYKFHIVESENFNGKFRKKFTRSINYQRFIIYIYPHQQRFDISTTEKMLFSGGSSEFETAMKNIVSKAEKSVLVTI